MRSRLMWQKGPTDNRKIRERDEYLSYLRQLIYLIGNENIQNTKLDSLILEIKKEVDI